jgi:hypothetical protein
MSAVCGTNERDKIGFVHLYSLHMNLMAREAWYIVGGTMCVCALWNRNYQAYTQCVLRWEQPTQSYNMSKLRGKWYKQKQVICWMASNSAGENINQSSLTPILCCWSLNLQLWNPWWYNSVMSIFFMLNIVPFGKFEKGLTHCKAYDEYYHKHKHTWNTRWWD